MYKEYIAISTFTTVMIAGDKLSELFIDKKSYEEKYNKKVKNIYDEILHILDVSMLLGFLWPICVVCISVGIYHVFFV